MKLLENSAQYLLSLDRLALAHVIHHDLESPMSSAAEIIFVKDLSSEVRNRRVALCSVEDVVGEGNNDLLLPRCTPYTASTQ